MSSGTWLVADALPRQRIRLAVVDDSVFVRGALKRMFESDPRIHVVGCASSGEDLLHHIDQWEPDVVTLDLNMPGMGGLATLDRVHAGRPMLPVIVLSSAVGDGAATTIEALRRDHVGFIDKQALSLVDFAGMRRLLVERIEALISPGAVMPAARWLDRGRPGGATMPIAVIVIGASTGGPPAIETILRGLGHRLSVPVVIAQHMPSGFTKAFAIRLDTVLPLRVREACNGDALTPGVVLITPGGYDLRLERAGENVVIDLKVADGNATAHPSVDMLFTSAAQVFGAAAAAALLSGMGTDGARGLAELHRRGAWTIAQDESTSVVYGMPGAAVALGAAREVTPLPLISESLRAVLKRVGEEDSFTSL